MADRDVRHSTHADGEHPSAGLARDLSNLARELHADSSMDQLLERVTAAAVIEVDGATYAGISDITRNKIITRAASDPVVQAIDDVQYEAGDGPCLTSLRDAVTVRADDLATDLRWPTFSAFAVERGVRSMLSVQLYVERENLGALNLYGSTPAAFSKDDERAAMLLAAHAAVAMKGHQIETDLREAVRSRDVIGQAKGILMERLKISESDAFQILVMASQRTHRKLQETARDLTETGELNVD